MLFSFWNSGSVVLLENFDFPLQKNPPGAHGAAHRPLCTWAVDMRCFFFFFYTPWHLKIAFFGDSVARHCVLLILWFVYISAFNVRLGPKKHTSTAYYWLFIYIQRERERPVEPFKNMNYLKFKGISHSTNPAAKVWTSPSYLPSTGYTVNDSSNQAERFASFLNNWTEMGKKKKPESPESYWEYNRDTGQ